jgi:citrate synthase
VSEYRTGIGTANETSISLLGHDLATDLIGRVGFGELAFWLVAQRRPAPGELRLFEAVLVALADHGFTPTVIAARLTLTGAPESVQGALAAGLLGGGSRFLGVTEDCGRFLADALAAGTPGGTPPGGDAVPEGGPAPGDAVVARDSWSHDEWNELARSAVRAAHDAGRRVPGLGHPVHRGGDPRTPVIIRIAEEEGVAGPNLRLFQAIGRVHPEIIGRALPLNGAGVCGAALADLGFPVAILRGFALLARAAGLLGHLAEELRSPAGPRIYRQVDRAVRYSPEQPA